MEESNYDHMNNLEKTNWWYQGKKDLFDKILQRLSKKRKFSTALDIGCGVGANLKVLEKYSESAVGLDFSEKAVSYCQERGFTNVAQGDVLDLQASVPGEKFDVVLCSELLEHVDDHKAIEEIANVTKQGGVFIFSVPAHMYLWNDNDDISQHQRRYEKKRLRKLLKDDFRILKLSYWNSTLFLPTWGFYKLDKLRKKKEKTNNLNLVPTSLNTTLHGILKMENKLFQKMNLPQGISLVGICVKK